jgi:hypothetical protein
VIGTEPPSRPTVWKWEYEELQSQSTIAEEEFQRQHEMRLLRACGHKSMFLGHFAKKQAP